MSRMTPDEIQKIALTYLSAGYSVVFRTDGTIKSVTAKQSEKPKAKTNAERQREYRERHKPVTNARNTETETVTDVTHIEESEKLESSVTDPSSPSPSLSPSPCPLSPPSPTPSSTSLPLIPSPQSHPHPHQPGVFDFAGVSFDAGEKKPHGKNEETDKTVLTLFSLFNRRPSTMLSKKERQALKAARIQPEDLAAVVEFYADSHPEWDGRDFRKRNLQTMLNNWTGEVDRATAWKASITPAQSERPLKPIRREETELDPAMAEVHRKLLLGIQGIDPNAPQPGEDDREFIYDRRDD